MQDTLRAKLITPDAAAALVKSCDWVEYGGCVCQPDLFDQALARRTAELEGVKIRSLVTMTPRAVLEADPTGDHFLWFNWHFSAYDRAQNVDGRCNYIPMNFGELPAYYRRFIDPPDVVCIKTCPMDEHGYFNFGPCVAHAKALTERAKIVIVETCERCPTSTARRRPIHLSEVTHVIDGGTGTVPELGNPPITDIDRKVAAIIAGELEDGSCLQIGIGGMPNAVCSALKDAGLRDLGIHTEMFVDGMVDLIEGRRRDGRAEAAESLRVDLHLRRGLATDVRLHPPASRGARAIPSTTRTCPRTSRPTTASSRSTTRRRSTCRARPRRSRTATGT
jgi:acyl-CoA hydrolase